MYEIPKWLKVLYTLSKILLTLLAVFILLSMIFLSTAEYSGSGSEALDGILSFLIVFGGVVLLTQILTSPLLLTGFAAAIVAAAMYRICRRELSRSGALTWESRELAWLYCAIVGVTGLVTFFISGLIGR